VADAGAERGDQGADLGELNILSSGALDVQILPRSGRIAWLARCGPAAEPPAESPRR